MLLTPERETRLLGIVDRLSARIRWPAPERGQWAGVRLVAHRGVHDGLALRENTLPAFDDALRLGIWGAELDLRWSADDQVLVHHDPDTLVGQVRRPIRRCLFRELRTARPEIPTLGEVAARVGGRLHLMLEIKTGAAPPPGEIVRRLAPLLAPLEAVGDYHLMSEDLELLSRLEGVAPAALLPIARFNLRRAGRMALARGWGGVTGHLLLVDRWTIRRHQRAGQGTGTGFANAPAALFREVRRGVRWIFSDNPRAMQELARQAGAPPCRLSRREAGPGLRPCPGPRPPG
jgi:glycerophosphoryl diester phosphodiesterase